MDSDTDTGTMPTRVSAMLSVARRVLWLTIALVVGSAIWYGLGWGLIEGYKHIGR